MTYQPGRFLRALSQTESGGDQKAFGDENAAGEYLAVGLFQIHPAWLWTYGRQIKPAVDASWSAWFSEIVEAFYTAHWQALPAVEIAMFFHLGHPSNPDAADWDSEYAARFDGFWAAI